MKSLKTRLIAKLHILLKETGADQHKEALYSPYEVSSSKYMSTDQLIDLIGKLEREKKSRQDAEIRSLRSSALSLLTEMGVYYMTPGEANGMCWERVNEFMKSDRIAGKPLYQLSIDELKAVGRKLRSMKDKGYRYKPVKDQDLTPSRGVIYMPIVNTKIIN